MSLRIAPVVRGVPTSVTARRVATAAYSVDSSSGKSVREITSLLMIQFPRIREELVIRSATLLVLACAGCLQECDASLAGQQSLSL